ncbi:MAG: DUF2163 domain-containing protein [Thermodesulfobacteriota bacterium]
MRTIDPAIITAIQSGQITPFLLLDLLISAVHYRYTDCDVPLVVSAARFNPRGFKMDTIRYSLKTAVDSVKIEIDNLNDELTAAFVGGDPQGSAVTLQHILLSAGQSIIGSPVIWFEGTLDAWEFNESKISVTVTSELVRWAQNTLAKHSASCRWKQFKGAECGYGGEQAWCDRTYARCAALGNTINFGGFRWLPSIENKEIWWGRTRNV